MMNLEKTIGIVTKGKSVMVDMETGEYLGNCRLEQKDDKNFHKVWILPFSDMLSSFSKKELKVMFRILRKTGLYTNVFNGNVATLAKDCEVSKYTVEEVLMFLVRKDFVRKIDNVRYMINPKVLYYGRDNKDLIRTYQGWPQKGTFKNYGNYTWQKVWIENLIRGSEFIAEDKKKNKDDTSAKKESGEKKDSTSEQRESEKKTDDKSEPNKSDEKTADKSDDDKPKKVIIDNLSGVQMKILFCLIKNMYDSNNTAYLSQREIADDVKVSLKTINVTMQFLQKNNIILYEYKGSPVFINPDITSGCNSQERRLLSYLFAEKQYKLTQYITNDCTTIYGENVTINPQ